MKDTAEFVVSVWLAVVLGMFAGYGAARLYWDSGAHVRPADEGREIRLYVPAPQSPELPDGQRA